MKNLENKLGYTFKNPELLRQALTRTSAINEKIAEAARFNYQSLELVGDAEIKSTLSALLLTNLSDLTEGQLHERLQPLIKNDGVMVQIAKSIQLDKYLIKSPNETITDKIRVDAVEAIIGAVKLDCVASSNAQRGPLVVIKRLWAPYLVKSQPASTIVAGSTTVLVGSSTSTSLVMSTLGNLSANSFSLPQPLEPASSTTSSNVPTLSIAVAKQAPKNLNQKKLSPRSQTLFTACGAGKKNGMTLFTKAVKAVDNVNVRNIGHRGDTPLGTLVRKETLNELGEQKIAVLIKAGASWSFPNNNGETPESILKKRHPDKANRILNRN